MSLLTVSQIARRTGITVRALHHYEARRLLRPAQRSAAGYRLYGAAELSRLQHIVSLKALGFSLDEIATCLDADAPSLGAALLRQTESLRASVDRQQQLLWRLESMAARVAAGESIDASSLLATIEATTIMDKYFSQQQLESLRARGDALGAERIRAVERAWPDVIAGMRAAHAAGKAVTDADVQDLARRWRALVAEFTGGDRGILKSANAMFEGDPDAMREKTGIDAALMAYARTAIAALAD